jgi:hypothetical protein
LIYFSILRGCIEFWILKNYEINIGKIAIVKVKNEMILNQGEVMSTDSSF